MQEVSFRKGSVLIVLNLFFDTKGEFRIFSFVDSADQSENSENIPDRLTKQPFVIILTAVSTS
jgi:hypothetical protein